MSRRTFDFAINRGLAIADVVSLPERMREGIWKCRRDGRGADSVLHSSIFNDLRYQNRIQVFSKFTMSSDFEAASAARTPSGVVTQAFRGLRTTAVLLLLLLMATLLVLMATTAPAIAATVIMVGGTTTPVLPDFLMSRALNGEFTGVDPVSQTRWQRVNVPWPAQVAPFFGIVPLGTSVQVGTDRLYATILATPGAKTILGVSAGSLVVAEVMRRLANDPAAPAADELNFVVIGDASQRPQTADNPFPNASITVSGYTFKAPPKTPYDLTVVNSEYDGWVDFPDRWWNLVADANAIAGMFVLHDATFFADLSAVPSQDITVTPEDSQGAVTTSYFLRAKQLPLLTFFPGLAPIESSLKQMVNAGYSRYDTVTSPAASVPTTATDLDAPAKTVGSFADALPQPIQAPARDDRPATQPERTLTNTTNQSAQETQSLTRAHSEVPGPTRQSPTGRHSHPGSQDNLGQFSTGIRGDLSDRADTTQSNGRGTTGEIDTPGTSDDSPGLESDTDISGNHHVLNRHLGATPSEDRPPAGKLGDQPTDGKAKDS